MSGHLNLSRAEVRDRVGQLRGHPGYSRSRRRVSVQAVVPRGSLPELGVRGGHYRVAGGQGRGRSGDLGPANHVAIVCRSWNLGHRGSRSGVLCPGLSGWGIDPEQSTAFSARPSQGSMLGDRAIACPGVSATWAWVNERIPERVHVRWQMAAEVGGGVGCFFGRSRPGGTRMGRLNRLLV